MFDYTNWITFGRFISTICFVLFVWACGSELIERRKRRKAMKEQKRIEMVERGNKETPDVLRVNEERELL